MKIVLFVTLDKLRTGFCFAKKTCQEKQRKRKFHLDQTDSGYLQLWTGCFEKCWLSVCKENAAWTEWKVYDRIFFFPDCTCHYGNMCRRRRTTLAAAQPSAAVSTQCWNTKMPGWCIGPICWEKNRRDKRKQGFQRMWRGDVNHKTLHCSSSACEVSIKSVPITSLSSSYTSASGKHVFSTTWKFHRM